jgi:hypothetical protein
MKVQLGKMLALGGVCAIMAVVGGSAEAQRDYRRPDRPGIRANSAGYRRSTRWIDPVRARREIAILKRTYDHEIRSGHPAAAMRAHMRASAIRRQLREQRYDDM